MFPPALRERLDAMIDDLIMDGGVEAASLVSILLAARDSLNGDCLVTLSRKVWAANNEIKAIPTSEPGQLSPPDEAGHHGFKRAHAG